MQLPRLACLCLFAALPLPSPIGTVFATPPPAAAAAAASSPAGSFAGEWKGPDNATGALELKLVATGADEWSAEMAFTFEGNRVATKFKNARVDGTRVELTFTWENDGTTTVCLLTGELKESGLEGRYKTDTSGEGTWRVRRL